MKLGFGLGFKRRGSGGSDGFNPAGVQLLFSRDGAFARAPLSAIDLTP